MNDVEIQHLFARCVAALNYRALRMEVRERPFALLLCVESFGRGQDWGFLDVRSWRGILCENDDKSIWRLAEIHRLLKVFAQKGWLVVDAAAGTYRLRPDQWPCWAEVSALIGRHEQSRLHFVPDADLNGMLALLSQQNANFSHSPANYSQGEVNYLLPPETPPEPPPPPENPTFSRSFVEQFVSRSPGDSSGSSKSVANRTPPLEQISRPSRDASMENGANRVGRVMFCFNDGYIADKLKNHPKGERLRRELVAQQTFTAKAFQRHFENNPARAREDLGWFLEANNPNARMNTHMSGKLAA